MIVVVCDVECYCNCVVLMLCGVLLMCLMWTCVVVVFDVCVNISCVCVV